MQETTWLSYLPGQSKKMQQEAQRVDIQKDIPEGRSIARLNDHHYTLHQ